MKAFIIKFSAICCLCLLLLTAISTPSCKKDATCHGVVHVLDTSTTGASRPVAGATVLLSAPSVGGQVTYTGTTDGTGTATFDVKLPAIFDIKATKSTYSSAYYGTGILRLDQPGSSDDQTVRL
jgi:hypothetical protein